MKTIAGEIASSTLTLSSGAELSFYLVQQASGLITLRMRIGGEGDSERYIDTPLTPLETERIQKILAVMGRGRA